MNTQKKEDIDLDYLNSIAASFGAFVMAIIAFIASTIILPFSLVNILGGVCLINISIDVFFAERLMGPGFKRAMDIYCVLFFMIVTPFFWFGTGGIGGAGAFWAIFAAVYCFFVTNGKWQSILHTGYAVFVFAIIIVNIVNPQLAVKLSRKSGEILWILSFIGVAAYIQLISYFQRTAIKKDRENLIRMQGNLSASYQQSIAMNEELAETKSNLELANKAQRNFNASMNHELRAPLNGIEGCLQILLADNSIGADAKETIKNAIAASKTINQTVNDILDYTKLEEGKFDITPKAFDLRDVLDNISTIFNPQADAKNLKLTIQIPKDTRVNLYADDVRIQQIMTNLISNGIKYTRQGFVAMSVTTERGHLKFSVSDTGEGMSEENVKTLFDPFTRFNLEKNSYVQGTGLGMNIVSNIINEMNGTIMVESTLGEGSTFYVDIPILFYDSKILFSTPRERTDVVEMRADLNGIKVLCVDDTQINRTVFKGLLKNTGAVVTTAECGSKAIRLCIENSFDIIFLDHMMPEMDGLETLSKIRDIVGGRYKDVPVIMFSGNSGEEYRRLYEENGADGYITKPVMFEELIACFDLAKV